MADKYIINCKNKNDENAAPELLSNSDIILNYYLFDKTILY